MVRTIDVGSDVAEIMAVYFKLYRQQKELSDRLGRQFALVAGKFLEHENLGEAHIDAIDERRGTVTLQIAEAE